LGELIPLSGPDLEQEKRRIGSVNEELSWVFLVSALAPSIRGHENFSIRETSLSPLDRPRV